MYVCVLCTYEDTVHGRVLIQLNPCLSTNRPWHCLSQLCFTGWGTLCFTAEHRIKTAYKKCQCTHRDLQRVSKVQGQRAAPIFLHYFSVCYLKINISKIFMACIKICQRDSKNRRGTEQQNILVNKASGRKITVLSPCSRLL